MTDTRTQVVFNDERGGFRLSQAALWVAKKLYGEDWDEDEQLGCGTAKQNQEKFQKSRKRKKSKSLSQRNH